MDRSWARRFSLTISCAVFSYEHAIVYMSHIPHAKHHGKSELDCATPKERLCRFCIVLHPRKCEMQPNVGILVIKALLLELRFAAALFNQYCSEHILPVMTDGCVKFSHLATGH